MTPSNPDNQLLFVYGTLKRGYGLNPIINKEANDTPYRKATPSGSFIGECLTIKDYTMYHAGYPVVSSEPRHPVLGELYEVNPGVFRELDRIEGGYDRVLVEVRDKEGTIHEAWMYLGKNWNNRMQRYAPRDTGCYVWSRNEKLED